MRSMRRMRKKERLAPPPPISPSAAATDMPTSTHDSSTIVPSSWRAESARGRGGRVRVKTQRHFGNHFGNHFGKGGGSPLAAVAQARGEHTSA
eukprot:1686865-Prymnesium_polylepis.1